MLRERRLRDIYIYIGKERSWDQYMTLFIGFFVRFDFLSLTAFCWQCVMALGRNHGCFRSGDHAYFKCWISKHGKTDFGESTRPKFLYIHLFAHSTIAVCLVLKAFDQEPCDNCALSLAQLRGNASTQAGGRFQEEFKLGMIQILTSKPSYWWKRSCQEAGIPFNMKPNF